ncbi:beta-lactamase hydrolase domain-containing protein [Solilutibacter pythonis]|uniref:beta-lactamase hydrolase domain-containing protein n=1 Tax=Solilutibacter pythonis TaxID=2483112 RepID=UPI001FE2ED62|nr:sulfur transferase domain-containing protein [Lysobacter pythonis]
MLLNPRPGLYTAAQPAAADWTGIAGKGVKTVINLRPQAEMRARDEAAEVAAAGMRYIEIPVANADAINDDSARELHQALSAAQGDGPVLLHCASANRAGGLLALMAAKYEGVDVETALGLGRKAGMKSTERAVRAKLGRD